MLIFTILLLAGIVTQLADASEEDEVARGVRFVCAEIAKDTPETLQLLTSKGMASVPLSVRSPGAMFHVPADGVVRLGLKSGKEDSFITYAVATIPDGVISATAILFPLNHKRADISYRILFVDDASVTGGDVYFLNTLDRRCAVRLDSTELILLSGQPMIYRSKRNKESYNAVMAISVEQDSPELGKKWELITASTWRLMPTRIEICIIYMNHLYQRPTIKGLTFFPDVGIKGKRN